MLFWLADLSDGGGAFNLFRYITFRAGAAFFTALLFGFLFGRPLINLLRKRGLDIRSACLEAGGSRLKPILMTSLTTIFGMVPLAFFGGAGAEQIQPIGQTIIGGMVVSTLITIFVTPTPYRLFNRDKQRRDIENITQLAQEET